jgi:hypothetical protein
LGRQLRCAAGGIRRSLDFPEVASVSPGLHQGTSILVTNPKKRVGQALLFPIILDDVLLLFHPLQKSMEPLYLKRKNQEQAELSLDSAHS